MSPVYVYACGSCGREAEVLHGMGEAKRITCCGNRMRRRISAPALIRVQGGTPTFHGPSRLSEREAEDRILEDVES